jgi:hypothetical protein
MQQILESVGRLIISQSTFKDRIRVLAESAGIDTRSHGGISYDIVVSLREDFKEMTYIKFIAVMLICMVRSYTGKDDSKIITDLDTWYTKYIDQMTVAERLFWLLLRYRLSQIQFEKPPWNEEGVPVALALIGDFTARIDTPVRIALIGEEDEDYKRLGTTP